MSDQKCFTTVFGVIVGVALVGVAVSLLARNERSHATEDIDDVIANAKRTLNSLSAAVESIKSTSAN